MARSLTESYTSDIVCAPRPPGWAADWQCLSSSFRFGWKNEPAAREGIDWIVPIVAATAD